MRTRRGARAGGSDTAKYNALIAARLDELESSVERVRSRQGRPRRTIAPSRRLNVASMTDALKTTDLHSMIEKTAALTSRWQETASMVGLIGRNVKSIASPVVGGLKLANPLSAMMGRVGGQLRNLGGAAGMANTASQGMQTAAGGGAGSPLSGLVSQVLASMQSGHDVGD